jgi:hypothetical protein
MNRVLLLWLSLYCRLCLPNPSLRTLRVQYRRWCHSAAQAISRTPTGLVPSSARARIHMPNILIVGATRGLGAALVSYYASQPSTTVYATSRSSSPPSHSNNTDNVHWLTDIDLMSPSCSIKLSSSLNSTPINTIYITAGCFVTGDFFKGLDQGAEIKMP